MRHTVLAPSLEDAHNLARIVRGAGWFARVARHMTNAVVLITAPTEVLTEACIRASFVPGLRVGYSQAA
jgi:hypothetical protein